MAKDPNILKNSKDPKQLVQAAGEFAAGDQQADMDTLLSSLSSTEFLDRLDSAADYTRPPLRLRLAKILRTLMDNPKPALSHPILVALTTRNDFVAIEPRQELLIRALVAVRPSPPPAIKFWDLHSQPDATWRHVVMDALCDNGSEPAVDLFEKKLIGKAYEEEERIAWMRDPLLRHRNDVPLLKVCKRMITASLEPPLKPFLVESLFDYRPDEWYVDCTPPRPPELLAATREAKTLVLEIATFILDANNKITLEPRTRAVVEAKFKLLKPP